MKSHKLHHWTGCYLFAWEIASRGLLLTVLIILSFVVLLGGDEPVTTILVLWQWLRQQITTLLQQSTLILTDVRDLLLINLFILERLNIYSHVCSSPNETLPYHCLVLRAPSSTLLPFTLLSLSVEIDPLIQDTYISNYSAPAPSLVP